MLYNTRWKRSECHSETNRMHSPLICYGKLFCHYCWMVRIFAKAFCHRRATAVASHETLPIDWLWNRRTWSRRHFVQNSSLLIDLRFHWSHSKSFVVAAMNMFVIGYRCLNRCKNQQLLLLSLWYKKHCENKFKKGYKYNHSTEVTDVVDARKLFIGSIHSELKWVIWNGFIGELNESDI